jgi:hypothetical protein
MIEQHKVNYNIKIRTSGLCSELNGVSGFYEYSIDKNCRIHINTDQSPYFRNVSIFDIFEFPSNYSRDPLQNCKKVTRQELPNSRHKKYIQSVSTHTIANFFKYTQSFQSLIDNQINKLNLPEQFICFHIRRGDKVGEKPGRPEGRRFEFSDYLAKSDQSIKTIFIMTDDSKCITESKDYATLNNLNLDIVYLTTPSQDGFSEPIILEQNRGYSIEELVLFFAEIEIAKRSKCFVGTITSNVFRYIRNQCINNTQFISLDK